MAGARLTVIGDGAVGLAVALAAASKGLGVIVLGAGAEGSASAVAAGMLAPASEALLDGLGAADTAALLRARALWDAWASRLELPLDVAGARHLGPADALDRRAAAAARLGITAERREEGLWLAQDARLDSRAALARLRAAVQDAGVVLRPGRAIARAGRLEFEGAAVEGEMVVAAGWGSAALAEVAPELAALVPVKGQLMRIDGPPAAGPVLRASDVYLAPGPEGWTVGATMEPGRYDLAHDPAALARLRAAAAAVRPELADGEARPLVGVRAATSDLRPLVGRSRSGAWLATGMRRNGWLLAPLVAEGIAAYLAGEDPDAALAGQARAWDPARVLTPELWRKGWA